MSAGADPRDLTGGVPTSPYRNVLIVGAGAVANGWAPVREALVATDPDVPEGEENLAFAVLIESLRQLAIVANGEFGAEPAADARERIRNSITTWLHPLRKRISERLIKAQQSGSIRLRDNLEPYVRAAFGDDDFCVVTTNWDLLLDEKFKPRKVIHVHGDVSDPSSLYLPSEFSRELYRKWDPFIERTWSHNGRVTNANWYVSNARVVAICGLSLSPLDPELQALFGSLPDDLEQVFVLDLEPHLVARRIRFHLRRRPSSKTEVLLLRPGDLEHLLMARPSPRAP